MTWPAGLQSLNFGGDFNQNLEKVTWPEGLESLTFLSSIIGKRLAESNVVLPGMLRTLAIGEMRLMC